jgi:hypothetical protein
MIVFHLIAPDCAFYYNDEDAIRNDGYEMRPLS